MDGAQTKGNTMAEKFDAIVIGAGQAGPAMAVRCGKEGLKTMLVERHRFGGTCVNNGCVPTKTLIASARAAHVARTAADFGVVIDGPVRVDMAVVKARKDRIVEASTKGVRAWLDGAPNVTVVEGHAQFVGPHRIRIGTQEFDAPRIFINVGGRAMVPDMPGIKDVPFLNNERIMHVDRVPEHLIVVGGSYIGLEFAQMYRRFGSQVTVVEAGPRLVGREDPDVSEAIREMLANEGIAFRFDATCIGLENHGDGVAITAACDGSQPRIEGSHILMATGRVPNTDDLGLAAAGITTDKRGYISVDEKLATHVDGVYALGDCNGRGAFTHTSWNDHEIAAANMFDGEAREVSERIVSYALFVDPPLARIGLTHTQVRDSGRPALASKMMMTRVGRAREMGETTGFMKVVVDAETKQILGAAILGVHGDEVIQVLLEVMAAQLPCTVINRSVHIHPTVAELLPTLLAGLSPLE
jgi:pyruvate/2-oxoglutarate dehydrogenase complex dihydrolipoamide dehydrogenase (E3) component